MKAQANLPMSVWIVIVLLVGAFITLLSITITTGDKAKNAADIGDCLISIQKAADLKKWPTPVKGNPLFYLDCPREEKIIKKNDVVVNGKIDQNKSHLIIAKEMRKCWQKIGQGTVDPVSDWNDVGDKSVCLVCSQISYDDRLLSFMKEQHIKEDTKPSDYLITNPLQFLIEEEIEGIGDQPTYYEYLFGQVPRNKLTDKELSKLGTSIVDHKTLILVRMFKPNERSWLSDTTALVAGAVALASGVILAIPTGGASLTLTAVGAAAIKGVFVASIFVVAPQAASNAFRNCPDCEGIGSIHMIPSSINLYEKNMPYVDKDGNRENKAVCDIIIN